MPERNKYLKTNSPAVIIDFFKFQFTFEISFNTNNNKLS